ncbi:uncharacterized protein PHALS_03716 [Plasmopara halstedii]|uniref:Uncharacterized protein n=1 Tax=Plasmopara halstedii TaxID=4781 RepID=A0A0P1AYW2_PLAHL|nr:uncharacterized protein PHALS_03716 [Plasmopara halstedii]CEG47054.1 hypothetical protein PHALS_03716 [Plasmopara halstedii]|eukprot:XP_024583423.1 hypothetical protein PHALS_03716 [Plasmopara halstedii]
MPIDTIKAVNALEIHLVIQASTVQHMRHLNRLLYVTIVTSFDIYDMGRNQNN